MKINVVISRNLDPESFLRDHTLINLVEIDFSTKCSWNDTPDKDFKGRCRRNIVTALLFMNSLLLRADNYS